MQKFRTIAIMLILLITALAFFAYNAIFGSNVSLNENETHELYIDNPSTINALLEDSTLLGKIIRHKKNLLFTAWIKRFSGNIKPGLYLVYPDMTNNNLVNIFRSGLQKPTLITFNNIRTKEELSGSLGRQLMMDSLDLLRVLNDASQLEKYGFNTKTAVCPFLPDSYEIYWNVIAESLYQRMVEEYNKFWNAQRLEKASALKLTKEEVITLASIVNEESNLEKEQPTIAGLYINRIRRGIPLQADPTLKFALNDFEKKRVVNQDKLIDSPYNTYLYKGLPPGPIRIPTKAAIDAVLNYKKHNYLFMCASADFSGEHHFSETLKEHLNYAKAYQKKLNELRIYK